MATVNKLSFDKTKLNSRLELDVSGKDIDYVVVNTLRRIILSELPIMVFSEVDIPINTTIFNNNYIKLYIQNIPVVGVKNVPLIYKKKKEEIKEDVEEDTDLSDLIGNNEAEIVQYNENLDDNSLNNLTMYLEYENTSSEIKTITTDDAKFYYMGSEMKNPYPRPVVLIKLQPGQKIKLSAKSDVSIENNDGKHGHTAVCAFNELKSDKYKFFLESRGQLSESELLSRACGVIMYKLKKFAKIFPDMKLKDGEIKIPKASHTMGNLISHGLNSLKECNYSTYYHKHMLDNEVFIKFGFAKETNVKDHVVKVVKNYIDVFRKLQKQFDKL